ncbi:putative ATPase/DNA-binding SARP family transcriptional activator [Actinoplanes lutulentus]|uniref:Putative ATPase n=1 Tax=Actinoplanes lutulentus TaxID=1287878 RepID=A0A327ZLU0_9ACTN|nr:BTAD domain-containing putative transcriptional regulator [Actinoplanes lutulentus]MBB2941026.1 putative ATPase/DNA-binding SARP family transcriptional activator [Actinoplanes lutulentus]RAK43335.1 putative ATPase [Actinoplanes lutulentus]
MSENGDRGELRVGLLGALSVRRGDADVPLPGARIRGLLVLLALAGGRPVTPAQLTDALWPDDRPADPANALQSLVSRLRRLLGAGDAVTQTEGGYRLAVAATGVDVTRFDRLGTTGRERLRAGDPAGAAVALGEAIALLRGPIAPELAEVVPAQATRIARTIVDTTADLAEAEIALGHAERAGARLTALLAEHPLDERLAALLIDALAAQGRQADALAVYERIRADLADHLGADPGAALRDRHLRMLRGAERVPKEGVREAPGAPPTNLPAPLTSFIGRDHDLARVDDLLAAGRLVTVLGPGGAGKTRLALEAARRRGGGYRDGAWLIDLASVTEPAKVGAAMVAAAGLRGSALFETANRVRAERDDLDVLADRLNGREILFVVDNCEHLIDAVAHLISALLVRCPSLRILATSREPLAIDGESLVPLGPLGLPPADAGPAEAAQAPAVRLFAERAGAVRPDFTIDAGTVRDIVQIVRGLDGLPLALELAAARLRTLALPELAAGLSDRFRLLTTGSRTAQPRHRTLRAVIAWSWNLLSDDERTLAERVAVLPGGVTARSAAAVIGGSERDVADLLAGLVDRSLLQLAPDGGRYRMLETLREYGIERLTEQGILDDVRGLAARHLSALVAEQDPLLRGADQIGALAVLRAEYDNILAALRHLCDTGNAQGAISLAMDLCWYWQMFGREADAGYWLSEALAVPGDADPLYIDLAEAVMVLHRTGREPEHLTESNDQRKARVRYLADRLLRHGELPGPQGVIAVVMLYYAGESEIADVRINRLVEGDDPWISALARMFRAQVAENNGDLVRVGADVTASLDGFRTVGDRWGQATVLPLRALLRQYEGDLDGALADLTAAKMLARQFGAMDLADEVFIHLRWADLHLRRGEPEKAAIAVAEARSAAERSDSLEMALLVDALEAGMLISQGELVGAEELLENAAHGLGIGENNLPLMGGDHGRAIIGSVRASLAIRKNDPETAENELKSAYVAAVETEDMPILAMVAVAASGLAALRGQFRDAAVLLGAAARLRGSHDRTDLNIIHVTARARAGLGDEGFTEAYAAGWTLESPAALTQVDPSLL